MSIPLNFVIALLYLFLGLTIVIVISLFRKRNRSRKRLFTDDKIKDYLISVLENDTPNFDAEGADIARRNKLKTIVVLGRLKESAIIDHAANEALIATIIGSSTVDRIINGLTSSSKFQRARSAVSLGSIGTSVALKGLLNALEIENDPTVLQYISNSVVEIGDLTVIPNIIDTLSESPTSYQKFAVPLITSFGSEAYQYILPIIESTEVELQFLTLEFCKCYMTPELHSFILDVAENNKNDLGLTATGILFDYHPGLLDSDIFLEHDDIAIRGYAIRALANNGTIESIDRLSAYLLDAQVSEDAVVALSTLLRKKPQFISTVLSMFEKEADQDRKMMFAKVLSFRIEYFLVKLLSSDSEIAESLLMQILEMGQSSAIIGFLNRNNDETLESAIITVLQAAMEKSEGLQVELQSYLNDSILERMGLTKIVLESKRKAPEKDITAIRILWAALIASFLAFPIYFTISNWDGIFQLGKIDLAKQFVIRFNYALVYYSASINSLYLLLLVVSAWGVFRQRNYWKIKKRSFLFKSGVLPSISIIAPAYNEEANIIESTNSLLNLSYPEYELIVVSDGSSDQTLNSLIENYQLEKIDLKIDIAIPAMPIRGIYASKKIPKLVVVDKANGGKADSLNVGINISKYDYVCGIDADSLLEDEALLKVAAGAIDSREESVASGGNILPINGCDVDRGHLTHIEIPRNIIARFQTIEYMRAFIAGRVGWSEIRSLLIISGAFGLFRKQRVLEIGGYLTASGQYHKDTVGEDMELVVRLSRHMFEQRIPHRFHYIFNANCWTEVPESMNILYQQRDRWQRGLLDILTYHRKMAFNPKYGTTGLVAFPYFVIFEAIGPLFEIQGYFMVILAGLLGLLNAKIALLLFLTTILMGIVISSASLLIAGSEVNRFGLKNSFVLLGYAVIENFGFRQVLSLQRVSGYISSLKKPKGWGTMVRKGIGSGRPA